MATAKKLPSGNWRVQASVTINKVKTVKSFTAPTQRKAELLALKWQDNIKDIRNDTSKMTVNEAIDEYVNIKSNILSPSTIAGYKKIQRNYINNLKDIKLCQITDIILQENINTLSKNLSPKTVSLANGLILSVIKQFAPNNIIGKLSLPQKKKANVTALNKNEIETLINGIVGNEIEIQILLALWLGLRRSEILALEWSDIDFEDLTISINKALVIDSDNNTVLKCTKTTHSERIIKLPNYIADKLKRKEHTTERIFDCEPNRITKLFPKICESLGLPKYRFHDLRHSMATLGVTLNIADKIMMARGGWNNIKTMKNIYQSVLDDDVNIADKAIDNYFETLICSHEKSHDIKKLRLKRYI